MSDWDSELVQTASQDYEVDGQAMHMDSYDTDGDGEADAFALDVDNDGQADIVAVDEDGDGEADSFGMDVDGDGQIDVTATAEEVEEWAEENDVEAPEITEVDNGDNWSIEGDTEMTVVDGADGDFYVDDGSAFDADSGFTYIEDEGVDFG